MFHRLSRFQIALTRYCQHTYPSVFHVPCHANTPDDKDTVGNTKQVGEGAATLTIKQVAEEVLTKQQATDDERYAHYKIFSSRRRTQQQQHSFTSWLAKEETAKGSSQQRQQTLEDHRLENHRVNSSQLIVSPIFLTTSICRTKQSKRSRQNTIFPTKIPHQSKMIKSSLQYRMSPRI